MADVAQLLGELGIEPSRSARGGLVVRVPTERRGTVGVHVTEGERTVTFRAFVLRGPDRAHVDVYRRLLAKNLETRHWRLALDADGDVFAVADAVRSTLDADGLDGLLGALSSLVDEIYDGVLRAGFDFGEAPAVGQTS